MHGYARLPASGCQALRVSRSLWPHLINEPQKSVRAVIDTVSIHGITNGHDEQNRFYFFLTTWRPRNADWVKTNNDQDN